MKLFYQRLQLVQSKFPLTRYSVNYGIIDVPKFIEQFDVDLDPDYQRGRVWTVEQQERFVGSALECARNIPVFWFNWRGISGEHSEVIDGKQRLTAICAWLAGDIQAVTSEREVFRYSEIDILSRRNLSLSSTFVFNFVELRRAELLRFYLSLNSGGTVHTREEIARVESLLEQECESTQLLCRNDLP